MSQDLNRDIYLYADFDQASALGVVEKLNEIDKEDLKALKELKEPEIKPIRLHISSYGGEAAYLQAILTTMNAVVAPIVTIVEGVAYSCGSFLSVAGDYRIMGQNARLLIHPPTGGGYGEISKLKDDVYAVALTNTWGIEHYAKYSTIDKSDLEEAFRTHKQWYITSEEALELGLVDEIIKEKSYTFDRKKKTFSSTFKGKELVIGLHA